MHGAGNDYIYIDATRKCPTDLPSLARRISDRHFGIGADGLVVILPSDIADFRMRMFNADGSEAQMCGNASRCIGKYVHDRGLTEKTEVSLETLAGIKYLDLHLDEDGQTESVTVDMGIPTFQADEIPVILPPGQPDGSPIGMRAADRLFQVMPAGIGNPHGVIFTDDLSDEMVLGYGPLLENCTDWPEKSNIEFVRVISPEEVEVRVWERGSGETMACGTGACASVAAGIMLGILSPGRIKVRMRGGLLEIDWRGPGERIFLTGGASFIAEGTYYRSE